MIEKSLKERVYSPYSDKNSEWCVVLGSSGIAYPGVRVENISFPLTITAIHGAVCSCLANGDRPGRTSLTQIISNLESYFIDLFSLDKLNSIPESSTLYDPLLSLDIDPEAELEKLTHSAVIPHSDFPVAALLKTADGYVSGVNIELESWTLGLCAERVSLFRAVSHGITGFSDLLITAPKGDFSSPCGACRQVLMEWMPKGRISLHHGDGTHSTHNTMDLLPYAFSSSKLTI